MALPTYTLSGKSRKIHNPFSKEKGGNLNLLEKLWQALQVGARDAQ